MRRIARSIFRVPCALLLCAVLSAPARAQTTPLWSLVQQVSGPAVSEFDPSVVYYAVGNSLHAVWTESVSGPTGHAAGSERWVWSAGAGTTINNFPSPIPSSTEGGSLTLFISGTDGFVYKLAANSGTTVWSYDTRRPTCAADQIVATPAIQLQRFSNSSFVGAHAGNDLVYVVTHAGCGGDGQNRIIAIGGTDGVPHWQFNASGAFGVGYGSEGCAIDYANNRLYCGTILEPATNSSLWSLDAISGALRWAVDAGSIIGRPTLVASSRLYVGNLSFQMRSYDVSGPSPLLRWIQPIPTGKSIRKHIAASFGVVSTHLFALDDGGVLHGYEDALPMPTPLWPPTDGGGIGYRSLGTFSPALGKLYMGRNDGRVEQMNSETGIVEAFVVIGETGTTAPAAFSTRGTGSAEDRLTAAALGPDGVVVHQYCAPWTATGCGVPVSVPEAPGAAAPSLLLSAPNPFSDATRLRGVLPHAAQLEIVVFDLQGQRVRTFPFGVVGAGEWSLEWDGRDDDGREVPSGVYLYRLRAIAPDRPPIETSRTFARLR